MNIPPRPGPRPRTTHPTRDDPHPHQQVDQHAPPRLRDELVSRARDLPDVEIRGTLVSIPTSTAFFLTDDAPTRAGAMFQAGREFAHVHSGHDGSLHLTLSDDVRDEAIRQGWVEPHPISGTPMLFAPRDTDDLDVVWQLLVASYRGVHADPRLAERDDS